MIELHIPYPEWAQGTRNLEAPRFYNSNLLAFDWDRRVWMGAPEAWRIFAERIAEQAAHADEWHERRKATGAWSINMDQVQQLARNMRAIEGAIRAALQEEELQPVPCPRCREAKPIDVVVCEACLSRRRR